MFSQFLAPFLASFFFLQGFSGVEPSAIMAEPMLIVDEPVKTAQEIEAPQPEKVLKKDFVAELLGGTPVGPSAKIAIVEFSDLQCPYCQNIHKDGTVKKLVKSGKGKIVSSFKYFPLFFHEGAKLESLGAICMGKLAGTPSEESLRNLLLSRNVNGIATPFVKTELETYARERGVNAQAFSDCLTDSATDDVILDTAANADVLGISGTPSFLIVNLENFRYEIIGGAQPLSEFKSSVNRVAK